MFSRDFMPLSQNAAFELMLHNRKLLENRGIRCDSETLWPSDELGTDVFA